MMHSLFNEILEAHGGMTRWNQFSTLSAHLSQGGMLWPLKGQAGKLDEVDITIQLHQPWTSHSPFGSAQRRTLVTPDHAAITDQAGVLLETLAQPRISFSGHQLTTPWSEVQLAYFVGYAIWNYFTMPFTLARPGFTLEQLPDWTEDGQTWRRVRAGFAADVATHSPLQTFYFSNDGLLRRHDYEVDISGGAPAVHYLSGHQQVQGIMVPTQHRVYVRDADLGHQAEPLVVSIDASAIVLA